MFRKIIAGTAVAGALTLGLAGVAGADTTSNTGNSGNSGNSGTKAALCAKLPELQSKVQDVENTVNNTWIPKLQAAETKAQQAGHTTLADRIAKRITHLQNRESKVNARLQKLQAKCSANG